MVNVGPTLFSAASVLIWAGGPAMVLVGCKTELGTRPLGVSVLTMESQPALGNIVT